MGFGKFVDSIQGRVSTMIPQPITVSDHTLSRKYPLVNESDRVAVFAIKPDMKAGPWIAGGAVLRWYQGQSIALNDIDIYCNSVHQATELAKRLHKQFPNIEEQFSSKFATTYFVNTPDKDWTIQIIKTRDFDDPQDIISGFDISVCKLVTDGTTLAVGKHTAYDIKHNLLRIDDIRPDSIKRFAKYIAYGYMPVEGLFNRIVNNPESKTKYNIEEEYNGI